MPEPTSLDVDVLENQLAAQSETKKQTHYFFTYVAWGMQVATALSVTLLIVIGGYCYWRYNPVSSVFVPASVALTARYRSFKILSLMPPGLLVILRFFSDLVSAWPIWVITALSSVYLIRVYGFRQILPYLGPVSLTLIVLVTYLYRDSDVIVWWSLLR